MSTAHDVGEDVNPVETLAAHVVGTRFEDLPQDAVNAAKTFILDSICLLYTSPSPRDS